MKLAHTAWLALFSSSAVLATDVFINEIHYDNSGSDSGEGIEIAGPAGTDLSGMSLALYNGSSSQLRVYRTVDLSGVIPNQQDGFGTVEFAISGIQNGSPDGFALIDNTGTVSQFLSYEGSFTAASGPAAGMTSIDIGVAETSSTPVGFSLQLVGTGSEYDDFVWQAPANESFGSVNTDQIFGGGGPAVDTAPVVINTSPADNTGAVALNASVDISFSESVNVQGNWFSIECSISGTQTASVEGGSQHFTLVLDNELQANEVCDVNVVASLVNDLDLNDGPDFMESDYSFRFGTQVDSPIRINEVDADTAGSDTLEFIELYDGGAGNTALDGLVVVFFNGSDDASYGNAIDLDGFTTDSDGFFLIGNASVTPLPSIVVPNNSLQNGADAVAVFAGNAVDFGNDTPVTGISLVDALVYDTFDSDDNGLLAVLTPGQAQQNEGGAGDKDNHANARVPDGGAALDTANYLQQTATPGVSNVPVVEIFDIQSAGMQSPFEGAFVKSLGNIVTAVDTNGFFMQTPVSRSDNNVETSDGIFVFTNAAPSVMVGDEVNVVGQVIEFFDFTEFSNGTQVTVVSNGNALPPVVVFDENTPSRIQPQPDNELERFEGMIVSFDGIASAATDRFGDTAVVAGDTRAFREPGIEYPGIAGLPVWDGNPEIFELNPDGLLLANQSLFAGQRVSATGPLGYSFGDYQVWPLELTVGETPDLLSSVRTKAAGEMTVGALNMFRPSQIPSVYAERLRKISQFVREVMNAPDILAVSEVESLEVLNTIAEQINNDYPSINYTAYLEEGNDIGGIDVGFLVRSYVEMDDVVQYGKDTIFEYDGSLLNDRPPLLFKGRVVENGSDFPVQVLVVHNRSLSRVDSSDRVRNKRLQQAQFVAEIVQDIQTNDPDVNLIVTGDFNAYQFTDGYVDVVGHIAGTAVENDNLLWQPSPVFPALTNQVNEISAEEQYSFVFGGSAQVLDHALTTTNLSTLVTDFEYARGNADSPANLVNNDENALRTSDHDGLVVYIQMDSDNDSVIDTLDMCAATSLPEKAPEKGLKPNHFALLDGDTWFDTKGKAKQSFSIAETAGCSCEQIVEQQGLGKGHLKHGCSVGVMKNWVELVTQP
ncbi:Ig-like domain-containing protein [Alteromonas sp. ASW11-36]|uniref:Ig-like domain-containing protein n=1 Tax=Alteromonas arenosi TaxID=3055817 RepID=A0ABT7SXI5_9ALTE|nr:Ig-like domain-containing protein [Alteromonas sp. ASW11-36]MDM7860907.1 Ig-like domain-containing protein [Alteromonas sp. ASW11-36]